jgi:hypothetical protein
MLFIISDNSGSSLSNVGRLDSKRFQLGKSQLVSHIIDSAASNTQARVWGALALLFIFSACFCAL